jgi:hypothetical protein
MKKSLIAAAASVAVATVPMTLLAATPAAASVSHQQEQAGAITIESWLYVVPSENVLSATVWDCFKITGAINDQGGGPTWANDVSYAAPNTMTSGGVTAASAECADKVPAGGFIAVPPPEPGQYPFAPYTVGTGSPGGLTTIYAVHTIAGRRGDIYITFAGTYNFTNSVVAVKEADGSTVNVQPFTTGPQCTWLITGGTGAYNGLQGDGTCFANAQNTFPWINHTEHGQVWWRRPS